MRCDTSRLKESVTVAQRQFSDAQFALITVEGECDECRRRLEVVEQRRGRLEALLCGILSHLVDHASLVDSVQGSLPKDMDHDLEIYLREVFAAVGVRTVGFHSGTSNVVETHSATLH